jgi:predicted AAA+ superfamily ATPase
MIIFERSIEPRIKDLLFKKRAILIFGPRQAGKTTLAKKIIKDFGESGAYFNCEEVGVRKHFVVGKPDDLKDLVLDKKIVVFDEAQTIQNIGTILKVFIDKYPDVQIIATGSSSFDLANKINEPLTGRSFEFILYPLSIAEIKKTKKLNSTDILEYMRVGMYPAIAGEEDKVIRENLLKNITTNYLYKDIYIFESIRSPQLFEDMIKMLAFQIGQLVSVNELSNSLKTSRTTVEKYLKLLEQSYIIKIVRSFSNNHRNELKKAFKVFFIDLGIRNVIADNVDSLLEREDKGMIFENMFFLELLKSGETETFPPQIFFWRTVEKMEIDFIVQKNKEIKAYECKWTKENVVFSKFLKLYPQAEVSVVTPQDFIN